ncbi:MAG: tetratricopeptide repeat protein [Mariniblastus sp.]|nr:tetratricopeptide repeat protein [Mariniblastus sp.]MDG2183898.1 tetratricopeptide repeat protein [Mariniblastus sp.]
MIPDQRTLRQWRIFAIVLGLGILSFQIGCSTLTGLRDNSSRLSLGNNALEARQLTRNGNLNCQTGELRKAELNQREAIRKNENDPWLWERLAHTLKKSGKSREAIEAMEWAVKLSDDDPRLFVELGNLYLDTGEIHAATKQAQLALDQEHRCGSALLLLGRIAIAEQAYTDALHLFQRAAACSPPPTGIRLKIAEAYQLDKKWRLANNTIDNILLDYPVENFPENLVIAKAEGLIEMNQPSAAENFLLERQASENFTPTMVYLLAAAQKRMQSYSDARNTLASGAKAFPNYRAQFLEIRSKIEISAVAERVAQKK